MLEKIDLYLFFVILQQTVLVAGAAPEIAVLIPPPPPQIALGLAALLVTLTAPKNSKINFKKIPLILKLICKYV